MARRSDHSRDELYALVMDEARNIIERDGMRGLTARSIATAIGYSPGTLYNLFDNLDDLALQINGSTLDDLYETLSQQKRTGDPEADLRTLLHGYLGFLERNPALWGAIFDFRLPPESALPEWYLQKVRRLMSMVEDAIAPLFAPGEESEQSQAAGVLWSSLHGISTLARDGRLSLVSGQSVPEMAESLIANYLAGLRARAGKAAPHA